MSEREINYLISLEDNVEVGLTSSLETSSVWV